MAKDVIYVRHRIPEYRAFQSPTGMTGRWLRERTEQVAVHARALAPKPGQGKGYATGETAANIKVNGPVIDRTGLETTVVADTDYSLFVHEPTRPHIITASPTKKLAFFGRKAMRMIYKEIVKHPGTSGNPFLTRALKAVFGGPGR